MAQNENSAYSEAYNSLERMQLFDINGLPRVKELGTKQSFDAAVEPAKKIIELYKKLSLSALEDFPDQNLNTIKEVANADYNSLSEMLKYDPAQGVGERDRMIANIKLRYPSVFQALHPLISYSMHRATDFESLEARARAAVQSIADRGSELEGQLENIKTEALDVLNVVKSTALEQGVSQQARYFKEESEYHDLESSKWFMYSWISALVLAIYAGSTFIIHKIPFLTPVTIYETVQIAVSKFLLFAVFSYVTYFCSKNYMSHRHNFVLNKHRQNALVTYRAIVDASETKSCSDIVLGHAASCIFSPQSTGYSAGGQQVPSANSAVELFMKSAQAGE